jgi:hypothetical protein
MLSVGSCCFFFLFFRNNYCGSFVIIMRSMTEFSGRGCNRGMRLPFHLFHDRRRCSTDDILKRHGNGGT